MASSVASLVWAAMMTPSENAPVPMAEPSPPSPSDIPPCCLSGMYEVGFLFVGNDPFHATLSLPVEAFP